MSELLCGKVKELERVGCRECKLGAVSMPTGYALMLNADESHYFWVREDGAESCIHWNRWAVYRGAKHDALKAA